MKFDEIYNTIMEGMELREKPKPFTRYSTGKSYGGRQRGRDLFNIPRAQLADVSAGEVAGGLIDAADKVTTPSTYTKLALGGTKYRDSKIHNYLDNIALAAGGATLVKPSIKGLNKIRKIIQKNPKKTAAAATLAMGGSAKSKESEKLNEGKYKFLKELPWGGIRNFFTKKRMNSKYRQTERDEQPTLLKIPSSKTTPGTDLSSKATFAGPDPEAWQGNIGGQTLKESLGAIGALKTLKRFLTRKASSGKIERIEKISKTPDATKKSLEPPYVAQFSKRAGLHQQRNK